MDYTIPAKGNLVVLFKKLASVQEIKYVTHDQRYDANNDDSKGIVEMA